MMSTVCNGNIGTFTVTGATADVEAVGASLKPPGMVGSARLSETLRIGVGAGDIECVDGTLVPFQDAVAAKRDSGAE